MRSLLAVALALSASAAFGQTADIAKQVYDASQDSVFLVYLDNSSGTPDALGSAFLVATKELVTNAHVAEAGNPVLAVGPVRVPLKIVRIDQKNDLAILSANIDLTSKPLLLASGTASPGQEIFAIGNPEGLEKTISQGIVSGVRTLGDRELLQITSPISHGSSGGPILNSKGEVVGIAVGMLENGQNLNFAVPVKYLKSLLAEKLNPATAFDVNAAMNQAQKLLQERSQTKYSSDPTSDYEQETSQLTKLMQRIDTSTDSPDALAAMACMGTKARDLSDAGIQAAQKLVRDQPSAANRALLSYALYDRAEDEDFEAEFDQKGSDEQAKDTADHVRFLSEAENAAREGAQNAHGNSLLVTDYVLGSAENDSGDYVDAIHMHSPVAGQATKICGTDLTEIALRDLIAESDSAKRPDDAEKWFRQFASLYQPTPFDWDSEGDRRTQAEDSAGAADAYENAATKSTYLAYDYCYAANARYFEPTTDADGVLSDGRKCVDASVKQTSDTGKYFKSELPPVFREMADVLEGRGVYDQALVYVQESLANDPNNAFSLESEAKIFADLQRNSECAAAAQAAITASDGKYPFMQFQLGYCLFASSDWNRAAEAFRIAAEGDPTDAVSAFDLGLCLSRQGFTADADHWFREALSRKPDDELRAKILTALQ